MRCLILVAYLAFNLIQGHDAWIGKINNSTSGSPAWGNNRNQSVGWLPPNAGGQAPVYPGQPQPLYPPSGPHYTSPTVQPQRPQYPPQYPNYNTSSPTVQPQPQNPPYYPNYNTSSPTVRPQYPPYSPNYNTSSPTVQPQRPPLQPLHTTTQRPYYPTTARPGYIGISPAGPSAGNDFTRLTYDIPGSNSGNRPNNSNVLNQLHRFKRFIPKTKLEISQPGLKFQRCITPDGRNGHCKHIDHCNLSEFKEDFRKVLDHMCIIQRSTIGVCCPTDRPEVASRRIDDDSTNEIDSKFDDFPDDTKLWGEKFSRIVSEDPAERGCGLASKQFGKISNGKPAKIGQWPWMAALISNLPNKAFCGGVLITDRHILTAAHCVNNLKPREFRVRLGEYDFNKKDETRARDFTVLESRLHIDFNPITYENDIAVVKLQRPTLFNSYVWPICMPPLDTDWQNHTGVVIGWGTQFFGGPFANKLMEVEVPIWQNANCQDVYEQNTIFDTVMCAGHAKGGQDSCQGDSGGPLMIQLPNKRWVVGGIVSWGIKCGEPNHPGIYTRVNKYIKWVIENSVF